MNKTSTSNKALRINLTTDIYGCFAEIGAGQEVAANFFKAGASSGTIAYTQSAYDMKVSDGMYGETKRYVSEERLKMMLFTEFGTLNYRLPEKAKTSRFFAFCNTVESLNYQKTNQSHGWIGIRFQNKMNEDPSEIILHVKMHDKTNLDQQKALGILGVNLVHAAYFSNRDIDTFLDDLMSDLSRDRIEIDMLRLTGPCFEKVDNRLVALHLVKRGITDATLFDSKGHTLQPSDELYKKNILLIRGRFRPITKVHQDILEKTKKQFIKDKQISEDNLEVIFELTIKGLTYEEGISEEDFVDRASLLNSLGYTVMISNFYRHYRMVEYLSTVNRNQWIGLAVNVTNVEMIFSESQYTDLPGGIFQGLGTGFSRNVKMFVYPILDENRQLISLDKIRIDDKVKGLFGYLIDNDKLEAIHDFNKDLLHIYPGDVLRKLQSGDCCWKDDVPAEVYEAIVDLKLFDYQESE